MKAQALLLLLSSSFLLPACGTGSPDAYVEEAFKISCQYLKKCEEEMWEQSMFESVSDCRDTLLDADLDGNGATLRDSFVESCKDFDGGAARKCLAAARKAKRSCSDLETVEEPACEEVCGAQPAGQALGEPMSPELVLRALEQMEASGELEPEPNFTAAR